MSKDWQRLARYAQRRRAELGLSQIEVAQRGPLSLDRVQAIEGAKSSRYRLATLVALERALEWAPQSIEAILAGDSPEAAAASTEDANTPKAHRKAVAYHQLKRTDKAIKRNVSIEAEDEDDEDPRLARAHRLLEESQQLSAEAQRLLAEVRQDRQKGA